MAMDENVPEECPGVGTEQSGKASACDGCPNQKICASAGPAPPDPDIDIIAERLSGVKHKILVLSGEVKIDDQRRKSERGNRHHGGLIFF